MLRAVTDEIMYELMRLSGQEYVDEYAQRAKGGSQVLHPGSSGNGQLPDSGAGAVAANAAAVNVAAPAADSDADDGLDD